MRQKIILSTINAKWIHPSLALRLLKANLGDLESRCEIIEFALRQPVQEKINTIIAAEPRILGFSVSVWNHIAAAELLDELAKYWQGKDGPVIVLGGPEVSSLPADAEIFRYANFIVRGEGEHVFREICEHILYDTKFSHCNETLYKINTGSIQTAYHLYSVEDIRRKLIYVESSRGCAFNCMFCRANITAGVRYFALDQFLREMNILIERGVKTIKFLDRTFNLDIRRAITILEFFLEKINERKNFMSIPFVVHFEMVPSHFPPELLDVLSCFPPGTLRLEIGIQTLNTEVSGYINRPSNPEKELETLHELRKKTNAIIHADLIAGLPGENMESFGSGFNRLFTALRCQSQQQSPEIQLGILKLLPGAPIAKLSHAFGMRYSPLPPYEVMETGAMPALELDRIKNFARFWELIVNRGLLHIDALEQPVFDQFLALSDSLLACFGKNWGIDKNELKAELAKKSLL